MNTDSSSAASRDRAPFSLTIDGLAEAPRVVAFHGSERVSGLYEFRVEFAAGELDLAQLLGRAATLQLDGVGPPRLVHGEVASVEYTGESRRWQLYELTLVPRAWRLLQRTNCRIFQHKTTAEVVAAVLRDAGLTKDELRLDLTAGYAPRNYCVQYRETDLAFVSRLLEEDGISYYFVHDEARAVMVLTDHAGGHPAIAGESAVWFHDGGQARDREHIRALRVVERVRPGKVSLREFNFHEPTRKLDVEAAAKRDAELEYYDYPGEYQEAGADGPHQGRALAKIRLEELQATRRQASGASDCMRLVPGHRFAVEGHRRGELNRAHVLTQVEHEGEQSQALDEDGVGGRFHYMNEFVCVDAKVPLRPARVTPRPVVRGVQSATVVGPPQEEIHVDEQGRVLIQFHWDRQGQRDERSSCWVRVSQSWAGPGWGAMFIPRIGHEVLVDFIEGDPDRPIITGRVYHGDNATPYSLPDEKTKSTIKSESSPGGGGFNELRFEDRKGAEEVFIHAQRDLTEVVLHDNSRTVGGDQAITITGDRRVTVTEGDESLAVRAGASTTTIEKDRRVTVVSGDSALTVSAGTHAMTAKRAITATSQAEHVSVTGRTNVNLTAETADLAATAHAAVTIAAKTGALTLVGKQAAVLASQASTLTLSAKQAVSIGSATSTVTIGSKEKATLASSDAVNISAVNTVSVAGDTIDVQGKKVVISGAEEITLQVGSSAITIKPDGITISGPKITSSAIGMHEITGALIKLN